MLTSYYDREYNTAKYDFVTKIIISPLFSAIGFVFNLIIIRLLRNENNKKNYFKKRFFKYLEMNGVYNLIFCLFLPLRFLNICINPGSEYCSNIYFLKSVQYFDIIILKYFLSSIKFCSGMTE